MTDAFLSYARKDKEFVRRIHAALVERGCETWVDWHSIPPSAEWLAEIRSGIEAAHTFLFMLSPDSVASEVCRLEIEHAVRSRKRLIPVVVRDVAPNTVPADLAALNWIFLRETDALDAGVELLVRALETDLEATRTHTRLLLRATEWEQHRRDPSFALRGRDLQAAEQWLAAAAAGQVSAQPTALQSEYVLAGRKDSGRRQRWTLAGVTAALIVSLGLGVFAEARRWEANSLRLQSRQRLAHLCVERGMHLVDAGDAPAGLLWLVEALNLEQGDAGREKAHRIRLGSVFRRAPALVRVDFGNTPDVVGTFSPDSARLALVSHGTIEVWDTRLARNLPMPGVPAGGPVQQARFSPDGVLWLVTGEAPQFRLHRCDVAGRALPLPPGLDVAFHQVLFSGTMRSVVTTTAAGWRVALWDTVRGVRLGDRAFPADPHFLQVNRDGRVALREANSRRIEVWELATGAHWLSPAPMATGTVALTPDGKRVAALFQDPDLRVEVWEPARRRRSGRVLLKTSSTIRSAQFCPDGRLFLCAGEEGKVWVWDAATWKSAHAPLPHRDNIWRAEFGEASDRIITASEDTTARVWTLTTAGYQSAPLHHLSSVRSARLSPDGRSLVSVTERGLIRLWRLNDGGAARIGYTPQAPAVETRLPTTPAFVQHRYRLTAPVLAADRGRLLVSTSEDNTARVWRNGRGEPPLQHDGDVLGAAVSPDLLRVATASQDQTARVWASAGGVALTPPLAHPAWVVSVRFSPGDGRYLLTRLRDHRVRVWDTTTGEPATPLLDPGRPLRDAGFSRDGAQILATDHRGFPLAWDLAPEQQTLVRLQRRVQVLSGHTLDPDLGPVRLLTGEFRRVWETMRRDRGERQFAVNTD